jgi:hypothetical protein
MGVVVCVIGLVAIWIDVCSVAILSKNRNRRRDIGAYVQMQLRKDQRNWVVKRETCQASVPCLDTIYRQRIAELGG